MRRVVYTCLFGHSELFNDFSYDRDGIDFVCFTDDPELRSDFWKIELLPRRVLDPARAAKKIKALAHLYLAQYDCSLYLDNTVRLKAEPKRMFEQYLAPSKSPLVCFRHFERDCVYDEAKAVLSLSYDTPGRVNPQMALYRHLGYPARNGLAKSTLLLRRHQDPALQRVMNVWHEQVLCHSRRDQLSLLPACWFEDFELEYMPVRFDAYELMEWPVIKDNLRVPRDFDDALYLELNPDLAMIGMDLRKHYLLSGQNEHRPYRRAGIAT
ncbi:glycosyltransferase domain-containing protein [uncultured Bradyrhizobium sp.]|uniref:glycosyltransferase domain-containing protein n=1 Tax=uncultured Bradyrhizobium sp. TaxID=199684 RepID=UPI0035CC8A55